MKTLSLLCLLTAGTLAAHAQTSPEASTVAQTQTAAILKAGNLVVLETTAPLSSKDAQVGQSVGMRVKYDVVINGRTVIKAGAPGSGQVTAAEHRKGMGKQGTLAIRPSVVQAVDGQMIPLVGTGTTSAGSGTAGAAIGLAVVVSPLFLLHKGKDASIPSGYEMQAAVATETTVK
jgi:hypothetical protein